MFQISPPSYTSSYSSRKPLLLASRNPNACPRFSNYMASAGKLSNDKPLHPQKRITQNPLLQRKPNREQDRRRQIYLNKVRQTSDDKKWEARSEQILRADFLSRQKQWELEQARSAPEAPQAPGDEEMAETSDAVDELEFVDHVLSQEDQELEAFFSSMEDERQKDDYQTYPMSNYGSDDEEYDKLFMEVMSGQEGTENNTAGGEMTNPEDNRGMDMS